MMYEDKLSGLKSHAFAMGGFIHLLYGIVANFEGQLKVILEIGTGRGTSTNAMLYGLHDRKQGGGCHLYTVDIKRCGVSRDEKLKSLWTFIRADSKIMEWDKEIDILLIDGDHSYGGVKADYEKYEPFVRRGGLILMHDVSRHAGVKDFFDNEIKYPKVSLPLSRAGMGIINKIS